MKLSILVFLIIGATLIFWGCSENNPSAPELSQSDQVTHTLAKPHLTGTIYCDFTGAYPYFWVGTIIIDGVTYDLRFKSLGDPPSPPRANTFEEEFEISNDGFTTLLLQGPNAGVLNYGNSKFVANGEIEVANDPFEMWLGRNVHINGIVFWEIYPMLPDYCTGTFRIN